MSSFTLDSQMLQNIERTTGQLVAVIKEETAKDFDDFLATKLGIEILVAESSSQTLMGRRSILLHRLVHRSVINERLAGI